MQSPRALLAAALFLGSPFLAEASRWNPSQSVSLAPPSPSVVTVDPNGNNTSKIKAGVEIRFLYVLPRPRDLCPTERPECHGSPGRFALEDEEPRPR